MNKLTLEHISGRLIGFLAGELSLARSGITKDSALTQLGADSLTLVKTVLFIEKEFKVSIPDKALTKDNFSSVSGISRCVLKFSGHE